MFKLFIIELHFTKTYIFLLISVPYRDDRFACKNGNNNLPEPQQGSYIANSFLILDTF